MWSLTFVRELCSDWPSCILFLITQVQQRLEVEKKKLQELEAEHLETGRSMKDLPVDKDEQSVIMLKYQHEQQELEYQQHVLDDLEFQMFEVTISDRPIELFLFF